MQVKSVLLTVGIGAVAGAATMLLIPRHSEAYRLADDAAHSLKQGAERVIDTIHQCGCIPIQWSIDTLDWQGLNAQQMVARVQQQLAPGAILLLHAGAQHTAQALPQLLQTIQDAGYTPVPVGELIYPDSNLVDHTGKQLPLENNK